MYEDFFKLNEKPFSIQPDPAFMFWGRNHRLAYAMLEYGVLNNAGISVITGGVGCGKTTLLHRLLEQLSDTHTVALLSNIQPERGSLLSWVLMGFNQSFSGKTHVELFQHLQSFFIGEYSKGKRCVLIIDEAQNLTPDMLEEIRMLSNINAGRDQLLQLILVGQPQLKEILNHPDMLQLTQRIGSDFHLTPLTPDEVHAYIDTRMRVAGAERPIFSDAAKTLIAKHSRGVPRVINILSDTALVYSFSEQEEEISGETVETLIIDKKSFGVFGLPQVDQDSADSPSANTLPTSKPVNGLAAIKQDFGQSAYLSGVETGRASVRDNLENSPPETENPSVVKMPPENNFKIDLSTDNLPKKALNGKAGLTPRNVVPDQDPIDIKPKQNRAKNAAPDVQSLYDKVKKPQSTVGIVILEKIDEPIYVPMIRELVENHPVVFVTYSGTSEPGEIARNAGAVVVKMRGKNEIPPARSRNAGFRQLRKIQPNLDYVQFIDAHTQLDSDWLTKAIAFMERRPEVTAVEGLHKTSKDAAIPQIIDKDRHDWEIRATQNNALVRVQDFIDIGGLRGDLIISDIQDFCMRTRGRGRHIWHLDMPMTITHSTKSGFKHWWQGAQWDGFEHAFCASLHGKAPERYRVEEMRRSLIWGIFFPALIVGLAFLSIIFVYLMVPYSIPAIAGGSILFGGLIVYLLKILVFAFKPVEGRKPGLIKSFTATLAHLPETLGILRFLKWRFNQKKIAEDTPK